MGANIFVKSLCITIDYIHFVPQLFRTCNGTTVANNGGLFGPRTRTIYNIL